MVIKNNGFNSLVPNITDITANTVKYQNIASNLRHCVAKQPIKNVVNEGKETIVNKQYGDKAVDLRQTYKNILYAIQM